MWAQLLGVARCANPTLLPDLELNTGPDWWSMFHVKHRAINAQLDQTRFLGSMTHAPIRLSVRDRRLC